MAWRMNYVVTTLPRTVAEVQVALGDWKHVHSKDGEWAYPDAKKVGYRIESPVVKDNNGRTYLCELVNTHYNPQQDTLIFVWKPVIGIDELAKNLQNVPDHDPNVPRHSFAGEQEIETIHIGRPETKT